MKFLEIKSRGVMELQAISLIGASTKRDNPNTIGMFGSGLKYAIASIMRQDIPFVVFRGDEEILLTTKEVSFGGQTFNQICINGVETSLTDSMGTEDWEGVFPFVREIYSNALDEDENATIQLVNNISAEKGFTTFYITAIPEIIEMVNNFNQYFVNSENALFSGEIGEIHSKRSEITIYRKGILAYKGKKMKSIFSYNCFNIKINESRVISDIYDVKNEIAELIESCTDRRLLNRWIQGLSDANVGYSDANVGYFEHDCILSNWWTTNDNIVLVEVIISHKYYPIEMRSDLETIDKAGRIGLPIRLLKRFLKYAPDIDVIGLTTNESGDDILFIEKAPSEDLFNKTTDAVNKLKKTAYKPRLENQIKYCKFQRRTVLGHANDNTIWLSLKLDTYSVDEIAKVILEEQEHLHSGFGDETRNFQDHLFNLLYNELIRGL